MIPGFLRYFNDSSNSAAIIACNGMNDSLPSITTSSFDSSFSSQSSFLDLNPADETTLLKPSYTVRFDETVQVRDYAITLGDHPLCRDDMALTLGWEFETRERSLEQSKSRDKKYSLPPRLSFLQRKRLVGKQRLTENDRRRRVSSLQATAAVEKVLEILRESWSKATILPPPQFDDIEGMAADLNTTQVSADATVTSWKRNLAQGPITL